MQDYERPEGLNERYAQEAAAVEVRSSVTYAAYGVPYGNASALAIAQRAKQPQAVPVLIGGAVERFHIDLAVDAILNGGTLHEAAVAIPREVAVAAPTAGLRSRGETRVTRGGEKRIMR